MINKSILVGRITKDPEIRHTSNNVAVCQFTLAVNRTFTTKDGEREADFITCVVWRNQAENLAKFIKKGGLLGVEGRIQTRTYEGESGQVKYITEVVCDNIHFLEPKNSQERTNDNYSQPAPRFKEKAPKFEQTKPDPFFNEDTDAIDVSDDDLPF